MKFFKFLHACYECLYVLFLASVVKGSAEAAYAAVALDANHALSLCKCKELVLEVFLAGSHNEANVHEGAVFLGSGAYEH